MLYLKLDFSKKKNPDARGIKTVVTSYQTNPDGSTFKDKDGKSVETASRTVLVTDIEVPQYESVQDAVNAAGSEAQLVKKLNQWVKAEAVGAVRQVGLKFSAEDPDEKILEEARATARSINPFKDRRSASGTVKERAARMEEIEKLMSAGASDEDLLAFLKSARATVGAA